MHKPAYIEGNRGITQMQRDSIAQIRRDNAERIFDILGKNNISISDWHILIDLLSEETALINNVPEFYENGTFLLLTSYVKITNEKIRDIFLHEVMQKAVKYPLLAFCLLNELMAFQIRGIWTIPQIKDMLNSLNAKNIEYRNYLR